MGLVTWFGRKLERDETTSLRAEAFLAMETPAAVNALRAVASFHETTVDFAAIGVPTPRPSTANTRRR